MAPQSPTGLPSPGTHSLAADAARSLPADLVEALDLLYGPTQAQQWLTRYALSCRRRKAALVYFARREAGLGP